MEYQTLYRRWRPHGFSDFVGQNHIVTTLTNAISSGKIAHAYLFTGPRGTGKTSTAKILAKALNCEQIQNAEPCDQCSSCNRINEGVFMDVLEIDAASNRGIDEIRDLREKVKFAPAEGKYKVYIIDEVHMLTTEAFNALLRTLEEPPQSVVFILATTEVHKIPLTILSRCQRFDFKRFTIAEIKGRLSQILNADGLKSSERALELIAEYSEGGMRDAVSLLEQVLAHSHEQIEESDVRAILGLINEEAIIKIVQAIKEKDSNRALTLLHEICMDGKDLFQFGRSLIEYYRNMLLASLGGQNPGQFTAEELVRNIETIANATNEIKRSLQGSLPLELAFIKLTANVANNDLETRVARLEAMLQGQQLPNLAISNVSQGTHDQTPIISAVKKEQSSENAPINPVVKNDPKASSCDWNGFIEAVKKKKRTLAALIQEGKPLEFNAVKLVVGMPPNLKFHLENLALPQNKELLEGVLKELTGNAVKIECIPFSESQSTGNTPKQVEPEKPEVLTKAVQLFGGEVRPVIKEEK